MCVGDVDIRFYAAFTLRAKSHSFFKIKIDRVLFIVCVCEQMLQGARAEVRGQLVALGSFLSPCGFWG